MPPALVLEHNSLLKSTISELYPKVHYSAVRQVCLEDVDKDGLRGGIEEIGGWGSEGQSQSQEVDRESVSIE